MSASRECSFDGCKNAVRTASSGLCTGHYYQRRQGQSLRPLTEHRPARRRDEFGRKQCRRCDRWLPEDEYHTNAEASDGLTRECKQCAADRARLRDLSITGDGYRSLLDRQGGACAVCRMPDPSGRALAVDHDHACCPDKGKSCGKCIRGLLCGPCNMSIGHMGDDPSRLRAAATYLEAA
ncbi:endonuclease VII domain-containing protein [Streptomyces sp. NPDC001520]|uniref:endonuclease VII domain-containing protein n=1 Tax=Streptomyces sp. NPDC001520 TaxID=3364581 RepID=UPI00367A5038